MVDSRNRFVGGHWGFCGPACPKSISSQPTTKAPEVAQPSNTRKPNNLPSIDLNTDVFTTTVSFLETSSESPAMFTESDDSVSFEDSTQNDVNELKLKHASSTKAPKEENDEIHIENSNQTEVSEQASTETNASREENVSNKEEGFGSSPNSPQEIVSVNEQTTTESEITESPVTFATETGESKPPNKSFTVLLPTTNESKPNTSFSVVTSNSHSAALTSQQPTSAIDKLEALVKDLESSESDVLDEIAAMLHPRLSQYLEGDRVSVSIVNTTVATNTYTTTSIKTSTTTSSPSTAKAPTFLAFESNPKKTAPYIKTLPTRPRCLTRGGPDKGQRCVFPFIYRNRTFDGCTEYWRQQPWWCATQVDTGGHLKGNNWGLCEDGCPHDASSEISAHSHSVSGSSSSVSAGGILPDNSKAVDSTIIEVEICQTVSGVDAGKTCKFPFTYQGKTYPGCTYSFGVEKPWCSTETDTAGQYLPGKWGYCSHMCPAHNSLIQECITVGGARPMHLCVFPFLTGSTLHWGCTSKDGGYWCPTKVDDHAEVLGDNWGWCKERCKENVTDPCNNNTAAPLLKIDDNTNFTLPKPENFRQKQEVGDETSKSVFAEVYMTTSSNFITTEVVKVASETTRSEFEEVDMTTTQELVTTEATVTLRSEFEEVDTTTNQEPVTTEIVVNVITDSASTELIATLTDSTQNNLTTSPSSDLESVTSEPEDPSSVSGSSPPDLTSLKNTYIASVISSHSTDDATAIVSTTQVADTAPPLIEDSASDSSHPSPNTDSQIEERNADLTSIEPGTAAISVEPETSVLSNVSFASSPSLSSNLSVTDSATTSTPSALSSVTTTTFTTDSTSTRSSDDYATIETSSDVSSDNVPIPNITSTSTEAIFTTMSASALTSFFNSSVVFRSLPLPMPACLDSGSCSGLCGGGSDYSCWCDTLCEENGDCCCDKDTHCSLPAVTDVTATRHLGSEPAAAQCLAGSCSGRCGGGSDADCWCDEMCVYSGDCCCDREGECSHDKHQVPGTVSVCRHSGSCTDRCGGGSDSDCWCDSLCMQRGDCCCDVEDTCHSQSPAGMVGSCTSDCGTDSTGPVKDKCCVFPFTYKGKRHNTCVEVDGSKAWCSTEVDDAGQYIHNMWGFCDQFCVFQTPAPYLDKQGTTTKSLFEMVTSSDVFTPGFNVSEVPTTVAEVETEPEEITTVSTTNATSAEIVEEYQDEASTVSSTTLREETTSKSEEEFTVVEVSTTTEDPFTVPVTESPAEFSSAVPVTQTSTTSKTTSTTTSTTTIRTTTTTTKAPYFYVIKASPYFLSQLPAAHTVVSIPATQYDPVRELLGTTFSSQKFGPK